MRSNRFLDQMFLNPPSKVWSPRLKRDVVLSSGPFNLLQALGDGLWMHNTRNRSLAERFGVSRGMISGWLYRLEQLGLIVRWSKRGCKGWTHLLLAKGVRVVQRLRKAMHGPGDVLLHDDEVETSLGACIPALSVRQEAVAAWSPFKEAPRASGLTAFGSF